MSTPSTVASDLIVFTVNRHGVITMSDGPGLSALGSAPGLAVGKRADALVEDAHAKELLSRALAGERIVHVTKVRGLDVEIVVVPTRNESRKVTGLTGAAHVSTDARSNPKDRRYVVRRQGAGFGKLVTEASGGPRCYDLWSPDGQPCAGCPVREATSEGTTRVVGKDGDGYRIFTATALDEDEVRVQTHHLPEALLTDLIDARVRDLAEHAQLSPREREALEMLLLGRSLPEIACALGIGARTAKFHKVNALRKLGAESTPDLLRVIIQGMKPPRR